MTEDRFEHVTLYRRHVAQLVENRGDRAAAMREAIGHEFEAYGLMERDLVIASGLPRNGLLVDVGCGSGRLAGPLSSCHDGGYLGTDIVPDLLDYARDLVERPDWRFELVSGLTIPAGDDEADMVCFFSVFTHLLHEESYSYLAEARRVLRPGGKIVFSFMEFCVDEHWGVFESNLASIGAAHPLNQFMSRDGIEAWAAHLDLTIEHIYRGDIPYIPLKQPIEMETGQRFEELGTFGQSVAVLRC